MTDAEQFLANLETAAKVAEKNWGKKYSEESDEAINQLEATMNFIDIANPAAVLRLVGMVREYDNEILRLRAEMERLEKEADWLARAASNNGWHGERVSPEWMRQVARKAVEEQCPKN